MLDLFFVTFFLSFSFLFSVIGPEISYDDDDDDDSVLSGLPRMFLRLVPSTCRVIQHLTQSPLFLRSA